MFENWSKRVGKKLKEQGIVRTHTYIQLLGCSLKYLEEHVKNKLQDNMTFDNYGQWELDHIKPITSFNLNNVDELLECCNYLNLQPLWKPDNIKKSNKIIKIDSEQEPKSNSK